MQCSPQSASDPLAPLSEPMGHSRQPAELIYQSVTVAAMLLLLGSLWVF